MPPGHSAVIVSRIHGHLRVLCGVKVQCTANAVITPDASISYSVSCEHRYSAVLTTYHSAVLPTSYVSVKTGSKTRPFKPSEKT